VGLGAAPARAPRRRGLPLLSLAAVVFFVLLAVFPGLATRKSAYDQNLPSRLRPPVWVEGGSWDAPFGTDQLGRDLLARVVYGAQISLAVAVAALAAGGALGLVVGVLAGYFGGWTDRILMRITDGALAIPTLFLALLFAVTVGPSFRTVIVAISLVVWSQFARVIRADVLRVKGTDFVAHARIAGVSTLEILWRHIVPNIMNTWLVLLSLQLGGVVVVEAVLGFLGAGVPPPTPSWGSIVSEGRDYVASAWWYSFFPGMAITLVVLAFNSLGDWVSAQLDPRLRSS
jgi:peptide/nickel transport system permease protein